VIKVTAFHGTVYKSLGRAGQEDFLAEVVLD
jgi:hypothetical protein